MSSTRLWLEQVASLLETLNQAPSSMMKLGGFFLRTLCSSKRSRCLPGNFWGGRLWISTHPKMLSNCLNSSGAARRRDALDTNFTFRNRMAGGYLSPLYPDSAEALAGRPDARQARSGAFRPTDALLLGDHSQDANHSFAEDAS